MVETPDWLMPFADPGRRFEETLTGIDETAKQRFYCDNFVELMGSTLA